MIGVTTALIGSDMHVDEKDFTITHVAIRVRDVGFSITERLDLGSRQNDARFPRLEYFVVESRALVARDRDLFARSLSVFGHGGWRGAIRRRRVRGVVAS